MKKSYVNPEILFVSVIAETILHASEDEVVVPGGDLFGNGN